jgi:hypothetical protein
MSLLALISAAACADAMSESPPAAEEMEESPKSFEFPLSKDAAAKCERASIFFDEWRLGILIPQF